MIDETVEGHEVSCPKGQGSLRQAAPGHRVSAVIHQDSQSL